jgi:ATP-dependent Lon protease
MNNKEMKLDNKIKKTFPDESINKIHKNYSVFSGKAISSFIRDWLIKKFSYNSGEVDSYALNDFLNKHIPSKDSDIKNKVMTHREDVKILSRFLIEPDIRKDKLKFSIPDLGIKFTEGEIPKYIAIKHNLKTGENWGLITLTYSTPIEKEKQGTIELIDFKPFKPYDIDLQNFIDVRNEYTIEEWVDLIIRAMEYNPTGFESLSQKLLFISRLLVFIEPNLNIIELAPKGTGKSYIFGNLSKYGWTFSGGTVSRAKLFYDIGRNLEGIITKYDFVALDEVQTITFPNKDELKGALKNYLESGNCSVANVRLSSNSGFILLGNIPLDENKKPINKKYFTGLPDFFHESALLDRFNGFLEGWKLPRINQSLLFQGYTLNVEYFSEILHSLRDMSEYSMIVDELSNIPKNADTRDKKSIKKIATAYMKLLFPNIKNPNDIDKELFANYCLEPAKEKRAIIRKQINLIDREFNENIPDITVK